GVVVSWRDWPGAGAAFATQAPSRSSCHGKQRFSWSDCAKAEGGASSTPQIDMAIKVKRRATMKSFGRPKNEARCQIFIRNGRPIAQTGPLRVPQISPNRPLLMGLRRRRWPDKPAPDALRNDRKGPEAACEFLL